MPSAGRIQYLAGARVENAFGKFEKNAKAFKHGREKAHGMV